MWTVLGHPISLSFISSPVHSHSPPVSARLWAPRCQPLWTASPGLTVGQWEAPADQRVGEQSVSDLFIPNLCVEVVPFYKHDFYKAAQYPSSSSNWILPASPPRNPFRLRSDKWHPTAASHRLLPLVCSITFDYIALSSHFIKGPWGHILFPQDPDWDRSQSV